MNDADPTALPAGWVYLGLAAFVAVMWLAILPSRPLFGPDEGRYAEIPREMLNGGDWIVPHLNGLAYVEKPPLQYWATALSLSVFGQNEFAARLYTALCALGTVFVSWRLAQALWGSAAAWRTAAVLSSSMLFVILGQLLTLDMSLTFYLTLALAGFLMAQQSRESPRAMVVARRWMLLAWTSAALGVLTKGLVAAAIPAVVLGLYSLYARDLSPWRRLNVGWGLPLFAIITVPWHWLAARRLPDFLQFFFVHEHLSRYMTPSADREEVWWFFVAVFLIGSMPWTVSAVRVVVAGWRTQGAQSQFDARLFLWMWIVFICVFFSLSDSKLIPYILPVMPALALLIGASPAHALRRDMAFTAVLTLLAALALGAASLFGHRLLEQTERNAYFLLLARPLAEVAAVLAAAGMFVLLRQRRHLTRAAVFLGVGWCLAGLLLMRAASAVAPVYSGIVLAGALGTVPRDEPIYSVGTYDQTLPFYCQRTVKLVAYRGELDYGIRHDPGAEIPSIDEFIAQWQVLTAGFAVMERPMFDDLKLRGVPMREVARDVRRILVARR